MLYNLYYLHGNGRRTLILEDATEKECMKEIQEYLTEHNLVSYYTRSWQEFDEIYIDIGSNTEYFILKEQNSNKRTKSL